MARDLCLYRYEAGVVDPEDLVQAYKWLVPAEKRIPEQVLRRNVSAKLKSVSAKTRPAQIAEAKKRVDAWKPSG